MIISFGFFVQSIKNNGLSILLFYFFISFLTFPLRPIHLNTRILYKKNVMNAQFCRVGKIKPNLSKFLNVAELENYVKYVEVEFKKSTSNNDLLSAV